MYIQIMFKSLGIRFILIWILCVLCQAMSQRRDFVKRLKSRVSLLESKVNADSEEFRQDIDYLMSLYNSTASDEYQAAAENDNCRKTEKKCHSDELLAESGMDILQNILQGFKGEKKFLRDSLGETEDLNRNLFQRMETGLRKSIDAFQEQITQRQDQIENRLAMEIRTLKDDLKSFSDKSNHLEKFVDNLRKVMCEEQMDIPGWQYFDGSCYYMFKRKLSWQNAKEMCLHMGAFLVEIDTEAENEFLLRSWASAGLIEGSRGPWIGASDLEQEGTFIWEHSGRSLESGFHHWLTGEPNGGLKENCLHKASWGNGWNDQSCNRSTTFTCERII